MTIKIGINGFGRIGRMVLRAAVQNFKDIEIVGINDLLEPDYLAYMLQVRFGAWPLQGRGSVDGNTLVVNGKKIRLTAIKDPAKLKWNEVGADIVIESTGLFLTKETAQKHIDAGARRSSCPRPARTTRRCSCSASTTSPTPARPSSPTPRAPPTAWHRWPRCCTTNGASSAA
jgi:glyceraldehyde 3-phosphate dehydrogenase